MNILSILYLNILYYVCSARIVFLAQNPSSFQDGSELNPYSSITLALKEISNTSNNEEIELLMKDNLFDNSLNEIQNEINGKSLRIK